MAERYEHLEKAMCKELEKLDKKYSADVEMTEQDAIRAKTLYEALDCAEDYHEKKAEAEEMEGYSGEGGGRGGRSYRGGRGRSYEPGRSPYTGRFTSREMGGGYSGGYPMDMIDPYWDRRY